MCGSLAADLMVWFSANRRDLPWRGPFPRDPYTVLVSEVMLQQTQVDRVVGGYRRFLAGFPTLEALATADEDDVVSAFSGLGYYRRARSLQRAAQAVTASGQWPSGRQELARLPGIGSYTSAALAAFSFGGHDPPVDGNVARVISRLFLLRERAGTPALDRQVAENCCRIYATHPSPELWEAIMELGATVCTRQRPRCDECPLSTSCRARSIGDVESYPRPRSLRASERQDWATVWLAREDGAVLLRRIDQSPVLEGLWLPPFVVLDADEVAGQAAQSLAQEAGFDGPLREVPPVRHAITFRRICVFPFQASPGTLSIAVEKDGWDYRPSQNPGLPTSSLLSKLRSVCEEGTAESRRPSRENHHAATDDPSSDR